MISNSFLYCPAIRWRQGEYQGLFRLKELQKDRIIPWITIPDIEFDFEEWKPKYTIDEHIQPFVPRFIKKWGDRPAWISLCDEISSKSLADGSSILPTVFAGIRAHSGYAIPAIPLGSSPSIVKDVHSINKKDNLGVALVIALEDLMSPTIADALHAMSSALEIRPNQTDIIINLGVPAYEPYLDFALILSEYLSAIPLKNYRQWTLVGTSIPESYKDIARGRDEIVRHEWKFFNEILKILNSSTPSPIFGDYTIVSPKFSPQDMRKLKPAGKLIYTTENSWLVFKGGSFRDNPAQMHDHCEKLVSSLDFRGREFSDGDDFIYKCAMRQAGPSNQPKWKGVSINHHISQVLDDLAIANGLT